MVIWQHWGDLFGCNEGFGQILWPIEKGCHSYSPEAEINITPPTQPELQTHHTSAA